MSSSQRSSANAVGGKTARACDSCMRRRARWYCTADDAFLCQTCDSTVHSANPLARRHDRVRLKTASAKFSLPSASSNLNSALPSWHQGFKRKARTPRHGKNLKAPAVNFKPAPLVPDLENNEDEEEEDEEEEEQLLYCVPIFDPVLEEFCSPQVVDEAKVKPFPMESQVNSILVEEESVNEIDNGFAGFTPSSDMELAEFAADMERLLGQGMEDNSLICIDGIGRGLEGIGEEEEKNQVKMEVVDGVDGNINNNTDHFLVDKEMELNFECRPEPPEKVDGEDDKVVICFYGTRNINNDYIIINNNNKVGLKLDYEAVMAQWSCQGCSPWTDGERPQFNPDDCLPDFLGMWGVGQVQGEGYGEGRLPGPIGQVGGNGDDGGREARVSRYREKRRTRLFSKKIRYEVRKLNAEKRPRMKGRFVKRASFPPPTASAVATTGPAAAFLYV